MDIDARIRAARAAWHSSPDVALTDPTDRETAAWTAALDAPDVDTALDVYLATLYRPGRWDEVLQTGAADQYRRFMSRARRAGGVP
jgi:hypothetical protein